VTDLAAELGVSARHLRRALEREYGVSPSELAQTCRLLLAKRLLADTSLSVTRIAFASGFQSLRRFNAAFREQYRMSPTTLRRKPVRRDSLDEGLRLTLAYRPPFDWSGLLEMLERRALPGVESISQARYTRTVRMDGQAGLISVANANGHLVVDIASSLVPALMPLLPRLRRLFDLDAEPLMIDDHLARTGLAELVRERPGVRLPGVLDPFEAVLSVLGRLGESPSLLRGIIETLGEPLDATCAELQRAGVPEAAAHAIAVRTLCWPDAFRPDVGVSLDQAEAWRPWRGYAAALLELDVMPPAVEGQGSRVEPQPLHSRPSTSRPLPAASARPRFLPQ
jgi:AraC family transcriptional regulator of adaptative response / DNA-3-methyladenine glycosylase II